jgi:hypothetical protein
MIIFVNHLLFARPFKFTLSQALFLIEFDSEQKNSAELHILDSYQRIK